jgi:DNA-binding NarL/FixJ family response regulator
MSVRVVLIDDHLLFRQGMRAVLEGRTEATVVAEAANAAEGYAAVAATNPDVVLLDLLLPGVNGITALRELIRREPNRRVLMLSQVTSEDFVSQAFSAGASGYALKEQGMDEVIDAITTVHRGKRYLAPRFPTGLLDQARTDGPLASLSSREQEVFDLLVRGFSNDGVAAELHISRKTVETHRSHILKKLDVHSVVDLLRLAARHGLLTD